MIYNIEALRNMYKEYSNINQKISLETKKGNLTRIKVDMHIQLLYIVVCQLENVKV